MLTFELNAAVRIGLDTATFIVANPNWSTAPQLVPVFDQISSKITEIAGVPPVTQEATLAFHVSPGSADFGKVSGALVNRDVVGEALFYGVSLHRGESALVIDKSLRHPGAAFVRLQRNLGRHIIRGNRIPVLRG